MSARSESQMAQDILVSMACGDALGAQVEFRPRGTFRTPTKMRDGGPHRLRAGQWTDDTAMALALADGLTAPGGYSRETVAKLWISWMDTGAYSCTGECFDIGSRTAYSLRRLKRGEIVDPARPFPDGNGAVMRVAPVAIFHRRRPELGLAIARDQALITHGHIAASAAVSLVAALQVLMAGGGADNATEEALRHSPDARDPRRLTEDEVDSDGHALDTLEASLWCVLNNRETREAILTAVRLGHDTDTTAAVTGVLAGALWGMPEDSQWLGVLAESRRLAEVARRLARG